MYSPTTLTLYLSNQTQSNMSAQPINKKLSCIDAVKRRRGNSVRPAVPSTAIVRSCRDRSASMSSYGATSGLALYESIEGHKKNSKDNNTRVIYSLTTFDTTAQIHYDSVDIHSVTMSQTEADEIVRPQNMTRLFATAIEEIAKLRRSVKEAKAANPNEKVVGVFELHTDGMDNQSGALTSRDLNSAVTAARNEGITCIFAGANQDAVTVGEQYGFDRDLSLTTDSTPQNASMGLRMASQAVERAVSGAPPQFTQAMRQSSAPVHNYTNQSGPPSPVTPPYSPTSTSAAAALLALGRPPLPVMNLRQPAMTAPPPGRLVRQTNNQAFV